MCAFSLDRESNFSLELLRLVAATAGLNFGSGHLPVPEASEATVMPPQTLAVASTVREDK